MKAFASILFGLALLVGGAQSATADERPAKQLFGAARTPAVLESRAIGSYARGCLAGAIALPVNGANWQVMRLSRNRNWGHPALVDYLERLAAAAPSVGWRGLLVGDMAQPRGGPMLSGHNSHQIGLDADVWLTQMPPRELTRKEREDMSAVSMLSGNGKGPYVDPSAWTASHAAIIKAAASDRAVARIFVNPGIKKALCEGAAGDQSWLRKIRPWWGHHYHFHVRLACPRGMAGCKDQDAPPSGDGCGAELAEWFRPPDPDQKAPPAKKPKPITLKDLPPACSQVLVAD